MNPNSMTNERLCTLAQKGDEAARELLVEKNMGFIVQTADIVYRSSSLEGSDLNIDVDDANWTAAKRRINNDRLSKTVEVRGDTSALRKAVQAYLRRDKTVKSFRLGNYGEGESGVTIVEFK